MLITISCVRVFHVLNKKTVYLGMLHYIWCTMENNTGWDHKTFWRKDLVHGGSCYTL